YIADMYHYRIRKVNGATHIVSTVAGSGKWGSTGDDGPATQASLTGPAGVAVAPQPRGKGMIFIADSYSNEIRVVDADGIIRSVTDVGSEIFGTPTRVAFAPSKGFLYVADSSRDRIVPLIIPRNTPNLVPPRPVTLKRTS